MDRIAFKGVTKSFGLVTALRPINLDIAAGEFVTLLGPSGSGKSTLLNIAAGHLAPSSGQVLIGDRDVTALPARRRNIGMVFQSYALFPHLNVYENVAYGLRARRVAGKETARRVEEALSIVQLDGYGPRAVRELSGGQQQRVALARALVIEPDALLLDEPLGALDRQLRKHVQLEIRRLHQRLGRTMIYVTHDQEEALVMSDRIAIMRDGGIEQIGTAPEIYRQPSNTFVAGFLGESNLIEGRIERILGGFAELATDELGISIRGVAGAGLATGAPAAALIRPEALTLSPEATPRLPARLEEDVYLGDILSIRLRLASRQDIWCRRFAGKSDHPSGTVTLGWSEQDVRILPIAPPGNPRPQSN